MHPAAGQPLPGPLSPGSAALPPSVPVLGSVRPAPSSSKDGWKPPAGWPPQAALSYTREFVTALLLLLALPYVTWKLLTHPGQILIGLGRKHATP